MAKRNTGNLELTSPQDGQLDFGAIGKRVEKELSSLVAGRIRELNRETREMAKLSARIDAPLREVLPAPGDPPIDVEADEPSDDLGADLAMLREAYGDRPAGGTMPTLGSCVRSFPPFSGSRGDANADGPGVIRAEAGPSPFGGTTRLAISGRGSAYAATAVIGFFNSGEPGPVATVDVRATVGGRIRGSAPRGTLLRNSVNVVARLFDFAGGRRDAVDPVHHRVVSGGIDVTTLRSAPAAPVTIGPVLPFRVFMFMALLETYSFCTPGAVTAQSMTFAPFAITACR